MRDVLWYLLAGTRSGPNRARIIRALDERPRNANQLADALDLDYKTVRHHLDVLVENDVLTRAGDGYGAVYRVSDRARKRWEIVTEVLDAVEDDDHSS
ncbi:MAG: winged helix-turn-helix domain-containing protein [Halodesulfurarchaeum sp.]